MISMQPPLPEDGTPLSVGASGDEQSPPPSPPPAPPPSPPPLLLATSVGPGRRGLTVRSSSNGGASWTTLTVLETGPAGYSALVDLGGGWAGCLYETREVPAAAVGSSRGASVGRARAAQGDDVITFALVNVSAVEDAASCLA